MRYGYKFTNLCGTLYKSGNVVFTPDGNCLLSPVGNRITVFDLVGHSSTTMDVETRSSIAHIAVSPDGRLVIAIDIDGYAAVINFSRRVLLHRFHFKEPVRTIAFSPDGEFIAVALGRKMQVWRTPGLEREFSPFVLHRTYTGHYEDITTISWSPNNRYIITGSKDMTARIYSRDPLAGYVPVTLSGHRDWVVGAYFADADVIYTVARDGAVLSWSWVEREATAALVDAVGELADRTNRALDRLEGEGSESDESEAEEGITRAQPEKAGDKRRRPGNKTPAAGTVKALMAREGGRKHSVKHSTDALASRRPHAVPAPFADPSDPDFAELSIARGEWRLLNKQFFKQDGARVQTVALHRGANLLVAGFSNGVFGLYTMPDLTNIHSLSISQHEIDSATINSTGDWLAFGSQTLGQLLVWEWKTETYILKQQGHYYDVNAVAYSPNGQLMVTGGDDGKVKVWNVATGFCFVTFSEHVAPVTAVTFIGGKGGHGLAVVSASLDGTVRAFDLVRYRNFRTLTAPTPTQFISLAADEAGEVVCAGSTDPFSIYVWSMQTGKLLDVLTGHDGPVCSLAYSDSLGLLASASWDKTVKLWDVFRSGTSTETFRHGSDVLSVAFRPDGQQLCSSTLDGYLHFWDVKHGVEVGSIDGRRDAQGGRKHDDVRTAKSSAAGKCFSSVAYTADGECVIAGGRTKYICLYAATPKILLKKWQISHNRSIDGILDKLSSKNVGEAGPLALLDVETADDAVTARKKADMSLPGVMRGEASGKRTTFPEIRTKSIQFSPSGQAFAVASTEGLLVYSIDESLVFDPFELGEDITPETVLAAIDEEQYARALLIALHLNEAPLIARVLDATPTAAIALITKLVPPVFLSRLIDLIAAKLAPGHGSPHLEFFLLWSLNILQAHGKVLKQRSVSTTAALRNLQKAIVAHKDSLAKLLETNKYMLDFICSASQSKETGASLGDASAAITQ